MAQKREKRDDPKSFVEGLRQVVQDLLVPELKAIQVTLQHHGELIQGLQRQMETVQRQNEERFTALQRQMEERFNALQRQMDERFAATQQQMNERFADMQRQNDERFAALQRQMDERFAAVQQQIVAFQQQTAEEFTKVWQVVTELLERQKDTQAALREVLNRLDVMEMVRETQTRQRVVEAQTEQLREEVAHLRRLLEMSMQQKGIQPTTP